MRQIRPGGPARSQQSRFTRGGFLVSALLSLLFSQPKEKAFILLTEPKKDTIMLWYAYWVESEFDSEFCASIRDTGAFWALQCMLSSRPGKIL